jgi:hypothetical protein
MSPLSLVIVVLTLSSALALDDQQPPPKAPTLIELAREHGGIEIASLACGYVGQPPTFEGVVRDAEIVIYGTVVGADAHLSADGREVWTDYRVQPIQVVHERTPSLLSTSLEPPTFTARGGTLIFEGLTITEQFRQNGLEVALNVGDEVVVLGATRQQRLTLDPSGVFMVRDGEVRSNGELPGFSPDSQAVPLVTFLSRICDLSAHH